MGPDECELLLHAAPGLVGDETPLVGRICALADVFDALISERPCPIVDRASTAARSLIRASTAGDLSFGRAPREKVHPAQ